ncbi:hypothetical protein [Enterococcus sp. BWR-S5]|uniref:hypothetical protein n=1 Tax=Enterococcus sp. BWR-S5 TaxID=2787714 RepID=UPI00192249C0|nr:hypothetical protein [Enterococcus sp. BWR-S5]MBL1223560.1 hypothetical protein [Enterococcus sp. BWR-S5]
MSEDFWNALENEQTLESIRKRPGMYIGALGLSGFENMMIQLFDELLKLSDSPEQAQLNIELSENQMILSLTCKKKWRLGLESEYGNTSYLPIQVLLALSEQLGLSIETPRKRDIRIYQGGMLVKSAEVASTIDEYRLELAFTPNQAFLGSKQVSYFVLFNRCQQLAMLYSGLAIKLSDGGSQKNYLCYEQGLVEYIFQKDYALTRGIRPLVIKTAREGVSIQAVISKNPSASIRDSFVNGHLPIEGGTHLDGFIQGAVDGMNRFLEETSRMKIMTIENFPERFDFVLSIQVERPRYAGAVKQKIRNPELYKVLREAIAEEVSRFLTRYPSWYVS